MIADPYIGIQMNQKDLTKTFMMIANWLKPFGLHSLYKNIQRFKVLRSSANNAEISLFKRWIPVGHFKFEISINVLVSSFRFIWIPMLWVYGYYKCFNSFSMFSAGIDFSSQNLTLQTSDSGSHRCNIRFKTMGLQVSNNTRVESPKTAPV